MRVEVSTVCLWRRTWSLLRWSQTQDFQRLTGCHWPAISYRISATYFQDKTLTDMVCTFSFFHSRAFHIWCESVYVAVFLVCFYYFLSILYCFIFSLDCALCVCVALFWWGHSPPVVYVSAQCVMTIKLNWIELNCWVEPGFYPPLNTQKIYTVPDIKKKPYLEFSCLLNVSSQPSPLCQK